MIYNNFELSLDYLRKLIKYTNNEITENEKTENEITEILKE